jgi:phytol kinase
VFVGGWLLSALVLAVYTVTGVFTEPFSAFVLPLTLIAAACTLVESLPFRDVDNITVTVTAAILGYFLF